jgi:O-antigen ligase
LIATGSIAPPRAVPDGFARAAFGAVLLYIVLVYLSPGQAFFDGEELGIAKAPAGVAAAALLLAWLLQDRSLRVGGVVCALLIGHFAIVGLSAGWSLWPSMSLTTFLNGLKYLTIAWLVANLVDRPSRAVTYLHVLALSSVIPAIGEINSWAHGEHLVENGRATWVGNFGNPNDLAFHLDVGLALSLGCRELTPKRWLSIAYIVSIGIMATGVLLTQSRGGLIAAGLVMVLWGMRGVRRGRTLLAVLAIVAIAAWAGPDATWKRARTTLDYQEDASAQGRIDAWRTGINIMKGRPLTGVGAGAFPLAWGEFAPGDAGEARTAHNTFIQVVGETGIPSFALFVGAIALGLLGLTRTAKMAAALGTPDGDRIAIVARSVAIGLAAFVSCSLTGGLAYTWPLYFLLGLAAAVPMIAMQLPRSVPRQHAYQ